MSLTHQSYVNSSISVIEKGPKQDRMATIDSESPIGY